jgi:hypothetical protein
MGQEIAGLAGDTVNEVLGKTVLGYFLLFSLFKNRSLLCALQK